MEFEIIVTTEEIIQIEKTLQPVTFTLREVSKHCQYDSCWIIIWNRVYDVTDYLEVHPGGLEIILEFAGSDATSAFLDKGHSKQAVRALDKYFIGELTPEDRLYPDLLP